MFEGTGRNLNDGVDDNDVEYEVLEDEIERKEKKKVEQGEREFRCVEQRVAEYVPFRIRIQVADVLVELVELDVHYVLY